MKNNTPEVRFPRYSGDWEQRKLGEISEKVTEKNKNNIYSETLTNSAEFGIINQRDYFDKDISNEKNLDGYYVVRPDDFVYNPRISNLAPVGPIKRNKLGRTGVMSPLYHVFRTHDVDTTYLEKYFSSNRWHIFMKLNGDSGARSDRFAIKDSLFREMPIPIPSIEEQTRVSNFFEELDETINLHQQELITLKLTKQGFLQKMFPKEGESVPEVRFPGFIGGWEQRMLESIYGKIRNAFVGTATPYYVEDGHFYLESNNVKDGQINRNTEVFINDEFYEKQKDNWLHMGDLVMVQSGHVGHTAVIPEELDNTAAHALIMFSNYREETDPYFLNYQLQTQKSKKKLGNITTGNTIKHILASEMKKFQVDVPKYEEQQTIGNFFKELDDIISLHQRELDALKETKKAFLQKMFV
ncbi:restriction endonuclease subunit S [Peribacillus simplex]|uniref:restriction endonuclease subunit S n=1 Tax=Peribacillus simplex TaxID=1478 RepID=UPI00298E17BD|nr:restriction endonuclease subunit S [Peribacillus simplex]MDW7614301.1 restriction endonuclease subunit S [Peribacillus simplex]